jgi:hypothetical protein
VSSAIRLIGTLQIPAYARVATLLETQLFSTFLQQAVEHRA